MSHIPVVHPSHAEVLAAATSRRKEHSGLLSGLKDAAYIGLNEVLARCLGTPQYLILFVSDLCWMKCGHCWYNEDWKKNTLGPNRLTFAEYERLARSIKRLAFLSVTGGEAFSRDDIVELITMFRHSTHLGRYQIPTSGFMTERIVSATERLLRENPYTPFRVDVSIDGISEIHDAVRRRPGTYDAACATIRELNRLKRRYSHFDVGVITTVARHNQNQIAELGHTVESLHPDGEWMVNIIRGRPRNPGAIDVSLDAYEKAGKVIDARIAAGQYKGHSGHVSAHWLSAKNAARRQIIRRIVEGRWTGGSCAAGSLAGVIYVDGSVGACEMLGEPLGNLRDFDCDLKALWRAGKAKSVRRFIQETRCTCTQECFLSMSMLIQPKAWPLIIRERLKLARAGLRRASGSAGGLGSRIRGIDENAPSTGECSD